MNPDKQIQLILALNAANFNRSMPFWQQVKHLNTILDNWSLLKKKAPNLSHKWERKFWELAENFSARVPELRLQQDNNIRLATKLYKRLYEFDEDRTHQLMMKHPEAFYHVEEEWAQWTRIIT